jgi:hypothetical protein
MIGPCQFLQYVRSVIYSMMMRLLCPEVAQTTFCLKKRIREEKGFDIMNEVAFSEID